MNKHISKWIAVALVLGVFPLISVYYLTKGVKVHREIVSEIGTYGKAPDFKLSTQYNESITASFFKNKATVVSFADVDSSGRHDAQLSQLSRIEQLFDDDPSVQLLTIIPLADSTSKKPLASEYVDISRKWFFATAPNYTLLNSTFFKNDKAPSSKPKYLLVDSLGEIRNYYLAEDSIAVNRLVTHIIKVRPPKEAASIIYKPEQEK